MYGSSAHPEKCNMWTMIKFRMVFEIRNDTEIGGFVEEIHNDSRWFKRDSSHRDIAFSPFFWNPKLFFFSIRYLNSIENDDASFPVQVLHDGCLSSSHFRNEVNYVKWCGRECRKTRCRLIRRLLTRNHISQIWRSNAVFDSTPVFLGSTRGGWCDEYDISPLRPGRLVGHGGIELSTVFVGKISINLIWAHSDILWIGLSPSSLVNL